MSASDPACDAKEIPAHLHMLSREVVPNFDGGERLWLRFKPDVELSKDGKPPPGIFNPDEQSFVRERFSNSPADVLYNIDYDPDGPDHFFTWGIAEVQAGTIQLMAKTLSQPVKGTEPINRTFSFKVVHAPEKCWYPHSEMHIYEDEKRVDRVKPSSVRTWMRDHLAENCRLRKYPWTDGRDPATVLA